MKKGLIRTIEAFLAIHLLTLFLASVQITSTPSYTDPYNTPRLKRQSESISLSLCNNNLIRESLVEEGEVPEIEGLTPKGLGSNVKIYNGSYLQNLVGKSGEFPEEKTVATSSCIVNTHTQEDINTVKTGIENLLLSEGEEEEVKFDVDKNERGKKNILIVEATQTGEGETSILVENETEKIEAGTLSFSEEESEEKTLNITDYLPDAENEYKVTLGPDVETSYNKVELNITRVKPNYDPKKVVVGVWNK